MNAAPVAVSRLPRAIQVAHSVAFLFPGKDHQPVMCHGTPHKRGTAQVHGAEVGCVEGVRTDKLKEVPE